MASCTCSARARMASRDMALCPPKGSTSFSAALMSGITWSMAFDSAFPFAFSMSSSFKVLYKALFRTARSSLLYLATMLTTRCRRRSSWPRRMWGRLNSEFKKFSASNLSCSSSSAMTTESFAAFRSSRTASSWSRATSTARAASSQSGRSTDSPLRLPVTKGCTIVSAETTNCSAAGKAAEASTTVCLKSACRASIAAFRLASLALVLAARARDTSSSPCFLASTISAATVVHCFLALSGSWKALISLARLTHSNANSLILEPMLSDRASSSFASSTANGSDPSSRLFALNSSSPGCKCLMSSRTSSIKASGLSAIKASLARFSSMSATRFLAASSAFSVSCWTRSCSEPRSARCSLMQSNTSPSNASMFSGVARRTFWMTRLTAFAARSSTIIARALGSLIAAEEVEAAPARTGRPA
mmetsp:Transcript_78534/g.226990  ORF Transcript_78534/g.226990 Transcript_78534/m.226990 type:complete len:419 (+) Transcript_78534:120-1376(+)